MTGDETRDDYNTPASLVRDGYYAGRLEFNTVAAIIGTEETMRMDLLQESLGHDPPLPSGENVDLPTDEVFYDGTVPTWIPEENTETVARDDDNQ